MFRLLLVAICWHLFLSPAAGISAPCGTSSPCGSLPRLRRLRPLPSTAETARRGRIPTAAEWRWSAARRPALRSSSTRTRSQTTAPYRPAAPWTPRGPRGPPALILWHRLPQKQRESAATGTGRSPETQSLLRTRHRFPAHRRSSCRPLRCCRWTELCGSPGRRFCTPTEHSQIQNPLPDPLLQASLNDHYLQIKLVSRTVFFLKSRVNGKSDF